MSIFRHSVVCPCEVIGQLVHWTICLLDNVIYWTIHWTALYWTTVTSQVEEYIESPSTPHCMPHDPDYGWTLSLRQWRLDTGQWTWLEWTLDTGHWTRWQWYDIVIPRKVFLRSRSPLSLGWRRILVTPLWTKTSWHRTQASQIAWHLMLFWHLTYDLIDIIIKWLYCLIRVISTD